MADNIIRVSVQPTKRQSVNITAGQVQTPISATADTSLYYSNLSKNWAIGEGLIQGEDYSSKHYANKSKASAQVAENFEASIRDSYNNFVTDATDYINELTELKETSAEEITMATTDGLLDIRNAKEEAVLSVETTKNDVIADITNVQNSAISNVEKEAKEQLQNIESTGFYMRDDKLYFINSKGEEEEFQSGGAGLQMFDTVLKDHVLSYEESKGLALQGTYVYKEAVAGSRYGYPDFYAKCLEEYTEAISIETVNNVIVKVHSNGHKFYDIADKEAIDNFFNAMGTAWFYGVDTENECVFLPRNNYFEQVTNNISEVGNSVSAGLPNITATATGTGGWNSASGAFTISNSGHRGTGTDSSPRTLTFNASLSSPIYGNSDTVQPNAVKKLLYICVGNTETSSAVTDVVEVTTTENDTIPLGYSTYQNGTQPSVSWLKSEGQWNDGNVYTTFYNEFVNKIGQDFASGKVVEVTDEYTDYDLVINQTDMTFRLPLLDGSEDLTSDKYDNLTLGTSGDTYTAPANGYFTIAKQASNGQYVFMGGQDSKLQAQGWASGSGYIQLILPVIKGAKINIEYNATGATAMFRFVYAQGNGSLYFKVANAVQNLELLDAGEVLEALTTKVDYVNTQWATNACMPDYSQTIAIATGPSTPYTAPADGYVFGSFNFPGNTEGYIYINGVKVGRSTQGGQCSVIPIAKGDVLTAQYVENDELWYCPMKGVN